jgi:hypothetical protein
VELYPYAFMALGLFAGTDVPITKAVCCESVNWCALVNTEGGVPKNVSSPWS